jgi:hypothetical protein
MQSNRQPLSDALRSGSQGFYTLHLALQSPEKRIFFGVKCSAALGCLVWLGWAAGVCLQPSRFFPPHGAWVAGTRDKVFTQPSPLVAPQSWLDIFAAAG